MISAIKTCDYSGTDYQPNAANIAPTPAHFLQSFALRLTSRSILLALLTLNAWGLDFGRMQQLLSSRFGVERVTLLREWQATLTAAKSMSEKSKLENINDFFNRRIAFEDDIVIWNQSDYWATPLDTLGRGSADCEDFTIVKYYSLLEAGVPLAKLRLVYVKAQLTGPAGPYLQAHMVLAYYEKPNAEPLVLDNLIPEIKPASQRKDLRPIFSFNSEAIWNGVAGNSKRGTGGTGQLSRWQDLLKRAQDEGFD